MKQSRYLKKIISILLLGIKESTNMQTKIYWLAVISLISGVLDYIILFLLSGYFKELTGDINTHNMGMNLIRMIIPYSDIVSSNLYHAGLSICLILVISTLAKLLVERRVIFLSSLISTNIGKHLFFNVLGQPYSWYQTADNRVIVNALSKEMGDLTIVIQAVFTLYKQFISSILILSGFYLLYPVAVSILVISFILIYSVYLLAIRDKFSKHSGEESRMASNILGIASSVFADVRMVQLNNRKAFYYDQYAKATTSLRQARAQNKYLGSAPPIVTEGILMVLIIAGSLYFSSNSYTELIPLFATFLFAIKRLSGSFSQIFTSYSNILSRSKAVENIFYLSTLSCKDRVIGSKIKFFSKLSHQCTNIERSEEKLNITFEDVSYKYPASTNYAISNFSYKLSSPFKIIIEGYSGSGKSTLLDLFTGLILPTEGKISRFRYSKNSYKNMDISEFQSIIGYVPQKVYLANESIYFNITNSTNIDDINRERVEELLKLVNMWNIVKSLPKGIFTRVMSQSALSSNEIQLSGGQIQRIGIARALFQNPSIMILDESLSALDISNRRDIMERVTSDYASTSILYVTHTPEEFSEIFDNKIKF